MTITETPKQAARRFVAKKLAMGYIAEAFHIYDDTKGDPLYWKIRLKHPQTGEKFIRPMSLIDGEYILKEPQYAHGEKPLYNFHGLTIESNKHVYITEGEKCADALTKLGLLATTSGGSDSAKAANWQILTGREVWTWADNDEAGKQYANDVKAILIALNCKVHMIDC